MGASTFTYDSTFKTKLRGPNVSYDSLTGFYPTGILGATLTYSGDKLPTHTKNGVTTTYTYSMLGLRRSKSTNGVTTQFIYDSDKLISLVHPSYSIYFLYHGDNLYGFLYEGDVYYYQRNILGEILGIVDSSGSVISTYSYTAYGEITSVSGNSLGVLNPMRYKGYFYDGESGYYYCKSRYYVPNIGRWLTPDKAEYLDNSVICGYNPFIYCKNNPIMYVDEDGNFGILSCMLIGAGVGLVVGGLSSFMTQKFSPDHSNINWWLVASGAVFGAIDGALSVTGMGVLASAAIGGALSGIQYCVEQGISGEDFNINGFFLSVGIGAISGAVLPGNFDGYAMSGIYNTSKGYLTSGTLKSAKKIGMYTAKVAFVKKNIIKRSAIYAASSAFTSGVQYGADYLFDDLLGWI